MDWCPSSSAIGFMLLLFSVFIKSNKNVDDLLIPFTPDPDLGSTVTSFHTRIRIKIDLQDGPSLPRVKGQSCTFMSEKKQSHLLQDGQEPAFRAIFA